MTDIKIVSGLNYGDESKGLVANFVSTPNSLTIMPSNSCQRAHTVVHNGIRKVFRHFGSGTLKGAATYFTEKFYVNPAMFRQEWLELEAMGIKPKVYCRKGSAIITAMDMFANVFIEEQRGDKSHSSTGCGVWEGMNRNYQLHKIHGNTYSFEDIQKYYENRLTDVWGNTPEDVLNFIYGEALEDNINYDILFFVEHITIIDSPQKEKELFHSYPLIVFENGQGLLLTDEWSGDFEHNTPAWCGAKVPAEIIGRNFAADEVNVESMYITRTYYTRHGKGAIGVFSDCSCNKNDINSKMFDKTNVPNPNQGTLRYGKINRDESWTLADRAVVDNQYLSKYNAQTSVVITHMNEFENADLIEAAKYKCDNVYASYDESNIHPISISF